MKLSAVVFALLAFFAIRLSAADIVLPTKTAKLEGSPAVYDDSFKSIRNWKSTTITARWNFDVPAKAAYRVFLTYACPPGNEGSEIEITAGTQRATGIVQSSGGWGRYKEFDLGPVLLRKPGQTELLIKISRIKRGAVWDLQSVRLVPEN